MEITRRRFLAGAAVGIVEAGLGFPLIAGSAKAASANDKIVVAHVGVGGMGESHVLQFAQHPDVETAAVCDVDPNRAAAVLDHLRKSRPDTRAVAVTDFRRLLDRKDIDVITYATPDHWHALNAILSFGAGKHVYGEKPLSYDLVEGEAMRKSCRQHKRVFQLGTQIHAGDNYHRVVELVRSGALGKIHTVRLWKCGGDVGAGFVPDSEPPAGMDWDMWLGPVPKRPYNRAICPAQWRFFRDYSGGVFADFWSHLADLPFWALDLDAPLTVKATAEDPLDHMVTTPGFVEAEIEFADLKMIYNSRVPDISGAAGKDKGIQFIGTKGELIVDYDTRLVTIDGKQFDDLPDVPRSLPRSPGHHRNFLNCVRSGADPESNIDHAARMTLPMHLASISYRLGRKLSWDASREEFIADDTANRLRHRPYRAPWSI